MAPDYFYLLFKKNSDSICQTVLVKIKKTKREGKG